jgi:alpha-tubulin suppressor-like RCC1 family protein
LKKKKESIFFFGNNTNKELGTDTISNIYTITNDILKNFNIEIKKIKKISCGWDHSLILIESYFKK